MSDEKKISEWEMDMPPNNIYKGWPTILVPAGDTAAKPLTVGQFVHKPEDAEYWAHVRATAEQVRAAAPPKLLDAAAKRAAERIGDSVDGYVALANVKLPPVSREAIANTIVEEMRRAITKIEGGQQ